MAGGVYAGAVGEVAGFLLELGQVFVGCVEGLFSAGGSCFFLVDLCHLAFGACDVAFGAVHAASVVTLFAAGFGLEAVV